MTQAGDISRHYFAKNDSIAALIVEHLKLAGKDIGNLGPADLATVDEFHIGGRQATLDLLDMMNVSSNHMLLDVGSGLGGPARTAAEAIGCDVTGIDLNHAFCDAATELSGLVGLSDKTHFIQADATSLPFEAKTFDSVMSMHTAMNIEKKDKLFGEAQRVLKDNGTFGIYDVLQGDGGEVLYPVPWARDPSISFLSTPDEMVHLLEYAGFEIVESKDTTASSQQWFEELAEKIRGGMKPPVTFAVFLGEDFQEMAENQVRNLKERRILTRSYICKVSTRP